MRRVLTELLELPGARFACAVDPTGGVIATAARTPSSAVAAETVLEWVRGAAEGLGDGVHDAAPTAGGHHVLVRHFTVDAKPLLVHLALDRHQADLDVARRLLGADGLRARLDVAGTGRTQSKRATSTWLRAPGAGSAQPAPATVPSRTGPGLVSAGVGTADSWLLIARLLADRSTELPTLRDESVSAA